MRPSTINNDLRDDFTRNITQANGAKLGDNLRLIRFRDKGNESAIHLFRDHFFSKTTLDQITKGRANNIPILVVDKAWYPSALGAL